MMRVLNFRGLLLIAGALCGACCCAGNAPAGEMRVDQWSPQPGTPQFVAVMGEVARPGVFELTAPLPELADLLRIAGGTSPSASGSVRVMRGGRMMQLFLSPKLHYKLLPNDLVVVESKQFSTARNFADSGASAGSQQGPAGIARASEPTIVQLGLVNLIARPVILDVTPDQTQLNQVLSLLRQPATGAGTITLIKPGAGKQEIPLELASQALLSSGTVLVFNPSTVNVGALPRLPSTVKPNQNGAAAAHPTVETLAPQTTAADSVPRVPSESAAEIGNAARSLQVVQAESQPKTPLRQAMSLDEPIQTAVIGKAPQVLELPAANDDPAAAPAGIGADDRLPETAEEPSAADRNAEEPAHAMSAAMWAMLTGLLVCCLAPLLWLRRKTPQRPPVIAVVPAQPAEREEVESSLETLISGSLKIVEEPLELPFEREIFGRPVERPIYVFDRAHELEGPHYKLREPIEPDLPVLAPQEPVAESVAEPIKELVEAPRERKVRIDRAHPRSDKGILDRVLATFEGEHS